MRLCYTYDFLPKNVVIVLLPLVSVAVLVEARKGPCLQLSCNEAFKRDEAAV